MSIHVFILQMKVNLIPFGWKWKTLQNCNKVGLFFRHWPACIDFLKTKRLKTLFLLLEMIFSDLHFESWKCHGLIANTFKDVSSKEVSNDPWLKVDTCTWYKFRHAEYSWKIQYPNLINLTRSHKRFRHNVYHPLYHPWPKINRKSLAVRFWPSSPIFQYLCTSPRFISL